MFARRRAYLGWVAVSAESPARRDSGRHARHLRTDRYPSEAVLGTHFLPGLGLEFRLNSSVTRLISSISVMRTQFCFSPGSGTTSGGGLLKRLGERGRGGAGSGAAGSCGALR